MSKMSRYAPLSLEEAFAYEFNDLAKALYGASFLGAREFNEVLLQIESFIKIYRKQSKSAEKKKRQ